MVESRKRGAKLVCIDPYRSRTAERCDWHLAPKPGTDAALALGMMHVLFRDGLVDRDYIASYCLGGEELEDRVREEYGLDRVSQITGLSAREIETLAREYGEMLFPLLGRHRHRDAPSFGKYCVNLPHLRQRHA